MLFPRRFKLFAALLCAFALVDVAVLPPAHATISTETRKAGPYAGNGTTTSFSFAFKVFSTSDITVTVTNSSGVQSVKTLDVDYSVSLNADQDANPGGTVTYPISGSALASGSTLTIDSDVAQTQGVDLVTGGAFLPSVIEAGLDRSVILSQQLQKQVDRAIKQPTSDSAAIGELPTKDNRKGKYLAFDATTGDPVASTGTADSGLLRDDLASTSSAKGASLVAIEDSAGRYATATVEGALGELSTATRTFQTVALLKAATARFDGEVVNVSCYYTCTTPDGGGGKFKWDSSSSASDNGGTILAPDAGGVGRWRRVPSDGVYRVAEFGAIPGQSAATVTAAINAAIDAAEAAGGGIVELAEGTYTINASLTTDGTKDIWLRGQGWSSIISTSTASVVAIDFGDATQDLTADIRVTDLRLTGAAGTSHGIRFKRLHSARVENVRVASFGGNGIELDRCYATWFDRVYSNNNTGSGLHSGTFSTVGNDFMVIQNGRFLANGAKGIYIEESAHGTVIEYNDIEGNAVGLQIDGGANATDRVDVIGNYFESQTGKNVSIAEDAGAARVDVVNFIGNTMNPGTVSAAANAVAIDDVRVLRASGNNFSTSNFTISANTRQVLAGPNKYSSSTNPFASTEPVQFIKSATGAETNQGFMVTGWDTRHRVGVPYSGDKMVMAANLLMTSDTAGTQDDTSNGSSALVLGPDLGRIVRTAAGGGASLSAVLRWDSGGNLAVGNGAPATSATDGFLYVPATAGTPTGTPTSYTGLVPIVVNSTNHKLYFYSGGAWRDAGP